MPCGKATWFSRDSAGNGNRCLKYLILAVIRQKQVDKSAQFAEINNTLSGRSSAWLERTVRVREAGGSNPLAPT